MSTSAKSIIQGLIAERDKLKASNKALREIAEIRKEDLEALSIENYRLKTHIDEMCIGFRDNVDELRKDADHFRWLEKATDYDRERAIAHEDLRGYIDSITGNGEKP